MKKYLLLLAIVIIYGCSSTAHINKKNEKAVNRVLGHNLVDEVIEKSKWLENHPIDTNIINVSYFNDTLRIDEELQMARDEERARLLLSLKGRCMNRDIQGVIDSLAIAMKKRDTVRVYTTKTVFYEDDRVKNKLKDTLQNKRVLIAELNGRIYEKELQLIESAKLSKELKKKNRAILCICAIAALLSAIVAIYFLFISKKRYKK